MRKQDKRLIGIISGVAILLFIPFIAMQFTDEVKWDSFDFVIMGGLLLGAGLACEFVLRKWQKPGLRFIAFAIILIAFLLTWAELAVGIFGTPFAGS